MRNLKIVQKANFTERIGVTTDNCWPTFYANIEKVKSSCRKLTNIAGKLVYISMITKHNIE